jgi:hypothetical protein
MLSNYLPSLLFHLLLATPVFLLLRWLFGKWRFAQKNRVWWAFGSTLLVYPALLLCLVIGFFAVAGYTPQEDFNREKWLATEKGRFKMKDDLLESKVLGGKSKQEVQQLLGKTHDDYTRPIWHYQMGASSAGFGFRFYTLRVEFEGDTVKKALVMEHLD